MNESNQSSVTAPPPGRKTVSTGVDGLDNVLHGGLTTDRLYLVEGEPGSGKTTLALKFLLEGVKLGERGLYVTLSETSEELLSVAESHGWDLSAISLFELAAAADPIFGVEQTLLHPWEVELSETVELITERVKAEQPRRVVFDSLSEMRLLAQDPLRYRRQILALKQFFAGREATVILIDDLTSANRRDSQLHSLCHGVITLERLTMDFGAARRRLQVQKLRGTDFIGGFHEFEIRRGGLQVFPRLIAAHHHAPFVGDPTPSGVPELDSLMGGGPLRGTTTLITGPAGTGKTTLALQYLVEACERGENCSIYEFDERIGTMIARARALSLDLQTHLDSGRLTIVQADAAELSAGEFASKLQDEVEKRGVRMIVVDSLNGYLTSMRQNALILQLHELLSYLNQQGVTTFLINPQVGLIGPLSNDGLNVSYIADAVVMLRYFEAAGRIRKAISVLKNRGGWHEDLIRELRMDTRGIRLGESLSEFRGVLTGTPTYVGTRDPLMEDRDRGS